MDLTNDSKGQKTNCECKDKVQQGEKGPPSERTKGLVPAVPPVLKNVGKLAAGVAGMASGSATEKKVEFGKSKMNDCKSVKKTTSTNENPKKISACIEYGTTTKSNEYEKKLQNKEPLFKSCVEYTEEETNYCCTCKENCVEDNSKNQKVKFEDPIHVCVDNWAAFEKQCSALKSNMQINDYSSKSQCSHVASNNIDLNRKRYDDLISDDDIVFSCNIPEYNNANSNIAMSTFINCSPLTPTNYDSCEKPETLNQSKDLCKLENGTFGLNNTKKLVSNKNDVFEQPNTLFNKNENSNKDSPHGYSETKDLIKSQADTFEFDSTKYTDVFGTSQTSTYENANKNSPNDNLGPKNLLSPPTVKPVISFTKNDLLLSNITNLPGTSKTSDENVIKRPNNDLEPSILVTSQMDKPVFDSTENTPLFSNTVDLFGTSNTFDEEKVYAYATESAPTFSTNIDLFEVKNEEEITQDSNLKKIDEVDANNSRQGPIDLFDKFNVENNLKDSDIDQNELFMNVEEMKTDEMVNTTKSAPLFSNTIDLFSTLNRNNNDIVYNKYDVSRPSTLKFSLVDVSDLSFLPEINKNTKYDPFFIQRHCIGVNNCNCKKLKDKEKKGKKSSLNEESCKMYTTMLGINACSHIGNPRNKTTLQPGHSLMDWIRLSHSGKDLTGVGPRAGTLSVSHKQLAEHNKEDDAWIAIRGKVYNVTAYFDFHPGGKEELMKGVGQDATQMFNSVHPWVNYESILQKCLVGRLTTLELDEEMFSLFYGRSNQTIQVPKNYRFISTPPANLNGGLPMESVLIPKFDWIQQLDYITTSFGTKPLSNAQVQVTAPTKENKLEIIITYCKHIFKNYFHFSNNIHWPCKVVINWDTGKIDVSFRKIESKIWDTYGNLTQICELVTDDYEYEKIKYIVLNNVKENHNTHLIAFQRIDGVKQTIPIGFHVKVYGTIDDQELIRCYTPVPCNFMRKYSDDYEAYRGDVCLLIKSYPEGLLSPTICNSVKGDVFEFSPPLGVFNMDKIASRSGYLFLAAGSGITPMLAIIKFILESTLIKCEKMLLLYFNRAEEDIILRKHFDALAKSDGRVLVKYVLSHPTEDWDGLSGHIDFNLLKTSIDELCSDTQLFPVDVFSLICGPLVFSNLAKSILVDIGYTDENIHLFGA